MGWFQRNDWNVIAVIFEKKDLFRINGNRTKGSAAKTTRDGAIHHNRTIYWAVFDQNRAFIEGGEGAGKSLVSPRTINELKKVLPTNQTIQYVLSVLESGKSDKAAKPLQWNGYPKSEVDA